MAEAKELYNELHQIFGPKPEPLTQWPHVKPFSPWERIGDGQPFYGPVTCGPAKGITYGKSKWPN